MSKPQVSCPCGVVFQSNVYASAPRNAQGYARGVCPACKAEDLERRLFDRYRDAQDRAERLRRRYSRPPFKD